MRISQVPTVHLLGLPELEQVTLTLPGPIPSKKNKLRPRMGGGRGQMYDAATKGAIDALATLAACQWGPRRPLESPTVRLRLVCSDVSQDRDGIWTTILDALKKGGVIRDDSIRYFNGTVVQEPAATGTEMLATVELTFTKGAANA